MTKVDKKARGNKPCTCAVEILRTASNIQGNIIVSINGETYGVAALGQTSSDGYRLYKADGAFHDIDTSTGKPLCDCWDALLRQGGEYPRCKHMATLQHLRNIRAI